MQKTKKTGNSDLSLFASVSVKKKIGVRGNSNMSLFNFIFVICKKRKKTGNSDLSLFAFVSVKKKIGIRGNSDMSLFNFIFVDFVSAVIKSPRELLKSESTVTHLIEYPWTKLTFRPQLRQKFFLG